MRAPRTTTVVPSTARESRAVRARRQSPRTASRRARFRQFSGLSRIIVIVLPDARPSRALGAGRVARRVASRRVASRRVASSRAYRCERRFAWVKFVTNASKSDASRRVPMSTTTTPARVSRARTVFVSRASTRDARRRAAARARARRDDGGGGEGKAADNVGRALYRLASTGTRESDESASKKAHAIVCARAEASTGGERKALTTKEWNFAIRAAARASADEDAKARVRDVWGQMRREMAKPSEYTLGELARGLCRGSKDVGATLATLREAVSAGATMTPFALDGLIVPCMREVQSFKREHGNKARDEPRERVIVDAISEVWASGRGYHSQYSLANTMKTFQLCGREDKAMEAFYDGEVETIDHVVLRVALQCLSKLKGIEAAETLYSETKRKGDVEVGTMHANVLLYGAVTEGNVAFATKLFDRMLEGSEPAPDSQSLTRVLLACAKSKEADVAMRYLEKGREAGVVYKIDTLDALLKACADSGRASDALGVFMDAIEAGMEPTDRTFTLLMESYGDVVAQPGQLEQALTIMDMGSFLNVRITERMATVMLRLCVSGNDLERGREELRKLCARGVKLTCKSTLSVLAPPYAANGDIDGAIDVIRFGCDLGIPIEGGVFVQCMNKCKVRSDATGALSLYRVARDEFDIRPSERMFDELFDVLGRVGMWEEALRILSDDVLSIDGSSKTGFSETAVAHLVRAFITAGELEQGVAALEVGKLLTNSANKLARDRLRAAQRREGRKH